MNRDETAFHAINRFGLGPKQGELLFVRPDPRGWLLDQLYRSEKYKGADKAAIDYRHVVSDFQQARKNKDPDQKKTARKAVRLFLQKNVQAELIQRQQTDQPLLERLAMFWGNHFTISSKKQSVVPLIPHYMAHAIRQHMNGKFSNMLLAVEQHPAMLLYLDNVGSVGTDSRVGKRRKRGLNENLAREILELHTMGASGGYTQDDIENLARIITGWGINHPTKNTYSSFKFRINAHDKGKKVLLGSEYYGGGLEDGIKALRDITKHPSTAQFIATKLARHFVSDNPPPSLVRKLSRRFMETDGDIKQVMVTLIRSEETWRFPQVKFKNPYEYAVASLRALPMEVSLRIMQMSFRALNFMPYTAPSPEGWPDESSHWATADAIKKRIDWSYRLTLRSRIDMLDINRMITGMAGRALSPSTTKMIKGAGSKKEALALLLVSPEFQRK